MIIMIIVVCRMNVCVQRFVSLQIRRGEFVKQLSTNGLKTIISQRLQGLADETKQNTDSKGTFKSHLFDARRVSFVCTPRTQKEIIARHRSRKCTEFSSF